MANNLDPYDWDSDGYCDESQYWEDEEDSSYFDDDDYSD